MRQLPFPPKKTGASFDLEQFTAMLRHKVLFRSTGEGMDEMEFPRSKAAQGALNIFLVRCIEPATCAFGVRQLMIRLPNLCVTVVCLHFPFRLVAALCGQSAAATDEMIEHYSYFG